MSEDSCQDIKPKSVGLRIGHSSNSVRNLNIVFGVTGYRSNSIYFCSQDRVGSNGISPLRLLTVWVVVTSHWEVQG